MKYYIITIKNNDYTKFNDKEAFDNIFSNIAKNSNHVDTVAYENDSHVKLHMHAICAFNKTPYYKKYQKKGYHIHFRSFPKEDLKTVKRYMEKEDHPLITNHYYHNYSMI